MDIKIISTPLQYMLVSSENHFAIVDKQQTQLINFTEKIIADTRHIDELFSFRKYHVINVESIEEAIEKFVREIHKNEKLDKKTTITAKYVDGLKYSLFNVLENNYEIYQ